MAEPAASALRRQPWNPILAGIMRGLNRMTTTVPPPPSSSEGDKILVVQVHPSGKAPSYTLALGNAVCDSLKASGALRCYSVVSFRCAGSVVVEPPRISWSKLAIHLGVAERRRNTLPATNQVRTTLFFFTADVFHNHLHFIKSNGI